LQAPFAVLASSLIDDDDTLSRFRFIDSNFNLLLCASRFRGLNGFNNRRQSNPLSRD